MLVSRFMPLSAADARLLQEIDEIDEIDRFLRFDRADVMARLGSR